MSAVIMFLLFSPTFVGPLIVGLKLIKNERAQDSHVVWLAGIVLLALGTIVGAIWLFLFVIAVLLQL